MDLPVDFAAVLSTGGPIGLLAAMLAWLVRQVTSGKLISGTTADRLAAVQQDQIDRQNDQIETLLHALGLPMRVIASLPVVPRGATGGASPPEEGE